MTEIKAGIMGFGTVGAGVASCLLTNHDVINGRIGRQLSLAKIADLDITTDRGVTVPRELLTTDAKAMIRECDIVVELIGGTKIAKTLILEALNQGKSVVTANKALLADYGPELFEAAEKNGCSIYFEASVGGGIPIIKSLRESFVGNKILSMYGILNGTCNYILTRMEREKLGFEEVLKDAQRLGYAEANPSLDIDGFDTAHKAAILASLAYGSWYTTDQLYVEGIRNIQQKDIGYAAALGYKIKLLAVIKQLDCGKIELRVHPTMVPVKTQIANISDVFNGVVVNGDYVGETLFYGRGAGRMATASAVVSDVIDAGINISTGCPQRLPVMRKESLCSGILPMEDVVTRYYMRITVEDQPGVLGRAATLLSNHRISIAELMQSDPNGEELVSIVILTHEARERDVRAAIAELEKSPEVKDKVQMIRIEELNK